MKSPSFDDWLLSDDTLDPEKEAALGRAIASAVPGDEPLPMVLAYHEVDSLFRAVPAVNPAPGFSGRWQARLAHQKARRQTLAISLSSLFALATAGIIAAVLLAPLEAPFSLAQIANSVISSAVQLIIRLSSLRTLSGYLLAQVPPAIPIALWVGLATSMSLVTLTWVYAMWRIIIPKGIKS